MWTIWYAAGAGVIGMFVADVYGGRTWAYLACALGSVSGMLAALGLIVSGWIAP